MVCLTSIVSLLLTLLILFGSVGVGNCSCSDNAGIGSTSAMTSDDDDRIKKVSENITTLERKLLQQIDELRTLLANQTAKQAKWITWMAFQEEKIENLTERLTSTERELKKVEAALVGQIAGLRNATNSTAGQLSELRNIWKAVNATIEETTNLTNKVDIKLRNIRRDVNESKESLLTNMASQLKKLQTKVDNEMETVWYNVNKARKCCTNLTSSFVSFRKNVANRSQGLEARIEIEEQKSNSTRQITELHFKKIQSLQNLLNSTRQDIKETSREHLTALSLAGNFTRRELQGIWTVVNSTKTGLLGQIKKVTDNLTEQLNQTQVLLQSSEDSLFASLINIKTSITEKVDNKMETVWFNLNKTRKCCTNLTSSFDSFRENVEKRSQGFEAKIEIQEQKSNSTRQITELHFKKIQSLQNLLNSTRQDIKEMSREHLTALSLAGNFTRRELQGIWAVINSTKTGLLGQIKKVTDNLTEQLNQTQVLLQSSDASLFASLININTSITKKINNVSKMTGPIGPRGFNGSQGPAGARGAIGPPGPKGAGDFSSCQYKVVKGDYVGGRPPTGSASITEPNGKRIVGAACSTTFAEEYNLNAGRQPSGKWTYVCNCRGTSTLFTRPRNADKKCSLHYWECPLTT
ncbi:uncharacterized protein LOC144634584 [Oculina patagonica]